MASHPLISTIVTLYTIILLYFPTIAASPLIISTSVLLLYLLRVGAAQRTSQENKKPEPQFPSLHVTPDFAYHDDCTNFKKDPDPEPVLDPVPIGSHDDCFNSEKDSVFEPEERPFYGECFVEWNVRAPLEVIYEAYEGEEEDEGTDEKRKEAFGVIERYASLSMYYPETDTDTDTSSDDGGSPVIGNWDDSPENVCFRWEDEDEDREELIEIELDSKRNNEVEEENLIEIDLNFPTR